jgi:spermidine dehydrogenase
MTERESDRGDSCNTTRREFVGAVVGSLVGATALAAPPAPAATAAQEQNSPSTGTANPSSNSTDYPPMLQGLRGQTQPAMEAAHTLRDGESIPAAADTGENYDIVIVGAGMSGLGAAYFYRKALPDAKVLILEACDDFGGHATRNEFDIDGRQLLAPGGTFEIIFPDTYTPEGKALLEDIGVNGERFYKMKDRSDADIKRYKLSSSVFFDRETFGVDRLVGNARDFADYDMFSPESGATWAAFLARTPLSGAAKKDILRLIDDHEDHMPGVGVPEKIKQLRTQSYANYLTKTLHIGPDAMTYMQNQFGMAILNVGAGPDSFSAWRAYNAHYPGFAGMNLPPLRVSNIVRDDQLAPDIHLPDGNGGVARLLVRWLIPASLPGATMEDSVVPHVDYALLDRPENDVRVRLSSTVVHAQHDTDVVADARFVDVTYMKNGRCHRVRAGTCIMACYNAIVPYLCPRLPAGQKNALHLAVRKPLVQATVAIKNWRAFAQLNVRTITSPGSFYYLSALDLALSLGSYRGSSSPDDPATVIMVHAPNFPGMPARDQYRVGRANLLRYTLDDYKQQVYGQLHRMLGSAGFDPARDVAGIMINRWAHGFACGGNDLYDPDWSLAESPWVKGRQRFGRIAIANSDAAGVSLTQAAFDQANRAVKELLNDVVEPIFYFSNPPRG